MIRALVLILGLVLGLCVALLVGGRLAHLRSFAPDTVPVWAAEIDGSAALVAGHGRLLGADLRWQLAGIGLRGPHWAVTLSGADWQAQGNALLSGTGLQIEALSGLIPGSLLEPGASGLLVIEGGALNLMMPGGWLFGGTAQGQSRGLTLDGTALDGPVTLRVDYGDWSLQPPVTP